jgi:sugar (pentulose or hexulose) kinase
MHLLAVDLGASSGRGIVGEVTKENIKLKEIHKFDNEPVKVNNYLQWDILKILHEIKNMLVICKNEGYKISSIGIDSWGVDYGLIDEEGELLINPCHYRDDRINGMIDKVINLIPKKELIKRTGMNCLPYNTIYQLMADKYIKKYKLKILNIPDILNYFLTGKMKSEFSIASTTQLFDYNKKDWDFELTERLGFKKELFCEITKTGSVLGYLKDDIVKELNIENCKVINVAGHDTACAVHSIKAKEKDFIFIATGTWVMVGTSSEKFNVNEKLLKSGFSNEGGVYPNINLLKNHMGFWLLQECKRHWKKEGINLTYDEMGNLARESNINSLIDIDEEAFYSPFDMPKKISKYCSRTNQSIPNSIGDYVRVIFRSLVVTIDNSIKEIETSLGKDYKNVYLIGGGTKDTLFCEYLKNELKKNIIIGENEATAMGNLMIQLQIINLI